MKTRPLNYKKTPSYTGGLAWIAVNDSPDDLEPAVLKSQVSVALLADLFGFETDKVASDVLAYRKHFDRRAVPMAEARRVFARVWSKLGTREV